MEKSLPAHCPVTSSLAAQRPAVWLGTACNNSVLFEVNSELPATTMDVYHSACTSCLSLPLGTMCTVVQFFPETVTSLEYADFCHNLDYCHSSCECVTILVNIPADHVCSCRVSSERCGLFVGTSCTRFLFCPRVLHYAAWSRILELCFNCLLDASA